MLAYGAHERGCCRSSYNQMSLGDTIAMGQPLIRVRARKWKQNLYIVDIYQWL